jgi:hypothetical protein
MKRYHPHHGTRLMVPSLLSAVTAGLAIAAAPASAQGQTGSRSDTPGSPQTYHQQHQQHQGAQATGSRAAAAGDDYSIVVWDPATGAWTYVGQDRQREQDRQTAAGQDRGRDEYSITGQREQDRQTAGQAGGDRGVADARAGAAAGRDAQARGAAQAQQRAQQAEWRDSRSREARQQAQQSQEGQRGQGSVSLEGKVQQFREVNLRRGQDTPEEHTWVRIQLESGYNTIVDLGREKDLSDLNLERGDRISVRGRHGTIGGENVLIADRIRVGNETINIERQRARQEVSGKVRDFREVDLQDSEREDHLVVRFEMEDGQRVVADLGSEVSLEDLEIERETRITLSGERRQIGNQQVLIAQRIRVDGESTELREKDRDQD